MRAALSFWIMMSSSLVFSCASTPVGSPDPREQSEAGDGASATGGGQGATPDGGGAAGGGAAGGGAAGGGAAGGGAAGGGAAGGGANPVGVGDSWRMVGSPVVKLIDTAPGELTVLVERHAHAEWEGNTGYVVDHPRHVMILRKGSDAPEELAAARAEERITDIAPGPEGGSVWVLAVRWNRAAQIFEPRLGLFAGGSTKREVGSFALEPARFESIDSNPPGDAVGYSPAVDTNDVYRLAARGGQLGVVGRNGVGTMFADRYEYAGNELTLTGRAALTLPYRGYIRPIMSGGTYDVLGWLANRLQLKAAMSASGTLYAGAMLGTGGLRDVDALWGSTWDEQLGLGPIDMVNVAMVFRVGPKAEVTPLAPQILGKGAYSSLLLAFAVDAERCLYGGLVREGVQGESSLGVSELAGTRRTLVSTHGSAALQALAVDASGHLVGAGSWDWSQNPSGLSISGGSRFVSRLPAAGEPWSEQNLLPGGRRRSEARSLVAPAPGVLCVGGMDNGPDTHAADGDIALLAGDGFVECLAW